MNCVAKERCKVLIANFQVVSTINQVSRFHNGHFQLCAEIAEVWNITDRAVSTLQQSVINHDFVQQEQSFQTFVLSQLNCNRWAFLNYPSCEMCTFSEYCTEILMSSLQYPFSLSWCSEMKTVLYGGKKSKWGIWVMAQMCHLKCFHIWAFSFVSVSIDLY